MLTVTFIESNISRTQVQLRYNRTKEGREDINDDARLGRPSSSTTDENIEAIKKMILDNRRNTIREVADDVGKIVRLMTSNFYGCFRHETCGSEDCSKIAKQRRTDIAQKMLMAFNDDPDLLKKVITSDESWVYGYDLETKPQSFRFATIEEIKEKSKQELLAIQKNVFQNCFEDWKKHWHK